MQAELDTDPRSGGWEPAIWIALTGCAVLALIVFARALALEGEFYDAYEVRVEAQRLLTGTSVGMRPAYRSTILILLGAGFEGLGRGVAWVGPALVSALSYAVLIACGILLAHRLGVRPWVAAATGLLLAGDHIIFVYAAHGMSDVPATAACALTLVLAARSEVSWGRVVGCGLALGLAALLRPSCGLLGLALLAGFRKPWDLLRLAVAGGVALACYLFVSTAYFLVALGGVQQALDAHGEVLRFMSEQIGDNRQQLGSGAPRLLGLNLAYLLTVFRSAPWLGALAILGAPLAWRRGAGPSRVVLAWCAIHLAISLTLIGHYEARYFMPAMPALAGLAALGLEWLARRFEDTARSPMLMVLALVVLPFAWSGGYEVQRLSDPAVRRSFPAEVARVASEAAGPGARYAWTTRQTFPVAPRVVTHGSAYRGDPWFGIFHSGPIPQGYALGQTVTFPEIRTPAGEVHPGLTQPDELRAFVRGATFEDGTRFQPGDVLLVGITTPSASWHLRGKDLPPFGVGLVVRDARGQLDVRLTWISQE